MEVTVLTLPPVTPPDVTTPPATLPTIVTTPPGMIPDGVCLDPAAEVSDFAPAGTHGWTSPPHYARHLLGKLMAHFDRHLRDDDR